MPLLYILYIFLLKLPTAFLQTLAGGCAQLKGTFLCIVQYWGVWGAHLFMFLLRVLCPHSSSQ